MPLWGASQTSSPAFVCSSLWAFHPSLRHQVTPGGLREPFQFPWFEASLSHRAARGLDWVCTHTPQLHRALLPTVTL